MFPLVLTLALAGGAAQASPVDGLSGWGVPRAQGPSLHEAPDDAARPDAPQRGRIFVNFDGAVLRKTETFGEDDATRDTSWLFGGDFAAYGAGPQRAAVLQSVRHDWAPYAMAVTDTRPREGDYVMAVVTPTNPVGGAVIGYAPVDCWDASSRSNIIFAFHRPGDGFAANAQATTISQELAHSFGLEHVDDPSDIMFPIVGGAEPSFVEACLPTVAEGYCGSQHAELCGDPRRQSSHRELLAMFGPATPDAEPPVATFESPRDLDELDAATPVRIVIDAHDDNAIDRVTLFVDGERAGDQLAAPYTWTLTLDRGTHDLYALARDHAGLEAFSDVIVIGVGEAPDPSEVPADLPDPSASAAARGGEVAGCRIGARGGPGSGGLAWVGLGLLGLWTNRPRGRTDTRCCAARASAQKDATRGRRGRDPTQHGQRRARSA